MHGETGLLARYNSQQLLAHELDPGQVIEGHHKKIIIIVPMDSKELLNIVNAFLEKVPKPSDKDLFEVTTYEDVREYISSIQSIRESTRNMINMKRIQPFLTGMEQFEKVLVALQCGHVAKIMACIWGPLRFLLEVRIDRI